MDSERAAIVLACAELSASLEFYVALGFRLVSILPADEPKVAVLEGRGLRLRLEQGAAGVGSRATLRIEGLAPARELRAPEGTRIVVVVRSDEVVTPPLVACFELSRLADARWTEGRAGMRYRDLLPSRQGGRFIISHISIPAGGPVPDYVHYHLIDLQFLLCVRGWVRVVYEDQGPAFVLEAGDCVLQPPTIRHRVLEASEGFEILEFGQPAAHETRVDHELSLPTQTFDPDRRFGGQRFLRDRASHARWEPRPGAWVRELGIAEVSAGVGAARIVALEPGGRYSLAHEGALRFVFMLDGSATLERTAADAGLARGDAVAIPAGEDAVLVAGASAELVEILC